MKKILLALLGMTLALSAGAQELIVIESRHLPCNDSVLVFVPQRFEANYAPEYCVECCGDPDPVPTLFLLHGWSGCYRDWSDHYDLQKIADQSGFIIICPDGFYDSWYVNENNPDGMQWRAFFHEELYPKMKEKYWMDPEKTFITGLSMGGHGAINVFLDDPAKFRAGGSMSGVLDLAYEKGGIGLTERLGPFDDPANRRHAEESAVNRIERAKDSGKLMLVSCGYSDSLFGASREFCQRCKELGVPYIEVYSPGTHSWKYWGYALQLHLWYFTRILNEENLGF